MNSNQTYAMNFSVIDYYAWNSML